MLPSKIPGSKTGKRSWLLFGLTTHMSRALKVFVGSPPKSASESGQYTTVFMHMEDLSVNSKVADIWCWACC